MREKKVHTRLIENSRTLSTRKATQFLQAKVKLMAYLSS